MSLALAITTDGRGEYLERTINSIDTRLKGDIVMRVLWDDSGDMDYRDHLVDTYAPKGYDVRWSGRERVGHAQSRHDLWQFLRTEASFRQRSFTHVAGWEDDFTLNDTIHLGKLVAILDAHPELSQVALLRDACYPREQDPGKVLGWPPQRFKQRDGYYRHRLFWTCNPSVFNVELCREGWPVAKSSEVVFGQQQFDKGRWSAFVGTIGDPPHITHIGAERAGGWY